MPNPSTLPPIAQLIVRHRLLEPAVLQQAIIDAAAAERPLVHHLVSQRLLSARQIAEIQSKSQNVAIFDLSNANEFVDAGCDEQVFLQHRVLPIGIKNGVLSLATSNLGDAAAFAAVRFHTRLQILPLLVEEDKLSARLDSLYLGTQVAFDDGSDELDSLDEPSHAVDDAPTVRFVQKLLIDAIRLKASDIHFELYEKMYRIRFRIDGVMQVIQTPPKAQAARITSYIKVISGLDIAEKRHAQDGRLKFSTADGRSVDFRVSTLPTLYGEKVVLRLLDSAQALIGLDALGMSDVQVAQFTQALQKPQGMILITGPTGSGKTVSLYTAMSLLNTPTVNILSCEDPVEIYLTGINQVNINPKIQLDFADVLRAFLRQDPDVIMIGEIRDSDTAQIATTAAQTGHLVLSTLHTNTAAAAITRLNSMGVPSFHLSSSLSLIIAQRLARKLCEHCKRAVSMPSQALAQAGFGDDDIANCSTVYEPVGCHHCKNGYRGRVGIFELLPVVAQIETLILSGASAADIEAMSRQLGNDSLKQAGIKKVMAGEISLSEMHRIINQ
ncbi:GspE/PulE family protein [Moraxella marmotae]|uniref:GspE/PulE family protein n=1 Tax=Moraxella marmotae TaxID=3344520 RepID=UPI0035F2C6D8